MTNAYTTDWGTYYKNTDESQLTLKGAEKIYSNYRYGKNKGTYSKSHDYCYNHNRGKWVKCRDSDKWEPRLTHHQQTRAKLKARQANQLRKIEAKETARQAKIVAKAAKQRAKVEAKEAKRQKKEDKVRLVENVEHFRKRGYDNTLDLAIIKEKLTQQTHQLEAQAVYITEQSAQIAALSKPLDTDALFEQWEMKKSAVVVEELPVVERECGTCAYSSAHNPNYNPDTYKGCKTYRESLGVYSLGCSSSDYTEWKQFVPPVDALEPKSTPSVYTDAALRLEECHNKKTQYIIDRYCKQCQFGPNYYNRGGKDCPKPKCMIANGLPEFVPKKE